jgi:integrase
MSLAMARIRLLVADAYRLGQRARNDSNRPTAQDLVRDAMADLELALRSIADAARPVLTAPQYDALLRTAEQIHTTFRTALILGHETGHRMSALRQLRWDDVDLDKKCVRWRGEHDKLGFEHETILTDAALAALREVRKRSVLSPWVLPSPTDPSQPVSRHLLRDWWRRGEVLGKLPQEPGRGWHSLRRQFATELKHVPLKDLCALGGWKSAQTILACYQQPDPVTMRQALARRQRLEA